MLQHLGLIYIILGWSSTALLLKRHGLEKGKTISQHAASDKKYHLLYGIAEISSFLAFLLFAFKWLGPEFNLGVGFYSLTIISVICMIIAAIIPQKPGWKGKVHVPAAYSMAAAIMGICVTLILNPAVSILAKIVLSITLAYMSVGWWFFIFNKKAFQKRALYIQLAYLALFSLSILFTTYT